MISSPRPESVVNVTVSGTSNRYHLAFMHEIGTGLEEISQLSWPWKCIDQARSLHQSMSSYSLLAVIHRGMAAAALLKQVPHAAEQCSLRLPVCHRSAGQVAALGCRLCCRLGCRPGARRALHLQAGLRLLPLQRTRQRQDTKFARAPYAVLPSLCCCGFAGCHTREI